MEQPTLDSTFTDAQKALAAKHGTPAEFAQAAYAAVPSFLSMDEAAAGIEAYNAEWATAAQEARAVAFVEFNEELCKDGQEHDWSGPEVRGQGVGASCAKCGMAFESFLRYLP